MLSRGVARPSLDDLMRMNRRELEVTLAGGFPLSSEALEGKVYRGVSLGLPAWMERLSWKTFQKTFYRDPETGDLRAWNLRLEQIGLHAPSIPKTRAGAPHTFGHYRVVPLDGARSPLPCPNGLLIHYGLGGNSRADFMSRLRDPIVALEEGNPELVFGWTYVDLGIKQLKTPSFFLLTLEGKLDEPVAAPNRARGV